MNKKVGGDKEILDQINFLMGIFRKRTNSYKFLFFRGLLGALFEENFEKSEVPLTQLGTEMLSGSWYSVFYFHLQLGKQDLVERRLNNILPDNGEDLSREDLKQLLQGPKAEKESNELLRYVPHRLLTPWFSEELRGIKDTKKDKKIVELSNLHFDNRKPLYRLQDDKLEMHPDWLEYLKINHAVVKGWADWEYLDYLQQRNPTVPALSRKLEAPKKDRETLEKQRKIWLPMLEAERFECIYTGSLLVPGKNVPDKNKISLDHFMPYSFVAHDQLWNLVPTFKGVNSSKGNSLPKDIFLGRLVDIHYQFLLRVSENKLPGISWEMIAASYAEDLKLEPQQLLNKHKLRDAYFYLVPSLISQAKKMGFRTGWAPSP